MSETSKVPDSNAPVSFAVNLVAPASMLSANDPYRPENTMAKTSLRKARMFEAAMVSLVDQPDLSTPITHLGGFAVELGLKSYLFHIGWTEACVIGIRHDLIKGWKAAHGWGLQVEEDPPEWLVRLSCLHISMALRYAHRDFAGFVLPGRAQLHHEIAELLSAVETHVGK